MMDAKPEKKMWHLYVLRCADGSLYAGITTDPERRLAEHNSGPKGARYTRARRPVALLKSWSVTDRSAATKAERHFKALRRAQKQAVVDSCDRPAWLDGV